MSNRKTNLPGRPRKPWEDDNGNPLPTETLKIVSKSWSPQIWEHYLKTLETPQREVLLPNFDRVLLKADAARAVTEYQATEAAEADDNFMYIAPEEVRKAFLLLTHRQREVVELVFFKGMDITRAAERLGISRESASRALHRALQRMKNELENRLKTRLNDSRKPPI